LYVCSDPLEARSAISSPLLAEMFRSLTALAFLAVLATECDAEGPGTQLRGSGTASAAAPLGAPAAGLPSMEHTECGCSQAEDCNCTRSGSAGADPQKQRAMEEDLLNHTQVLSAWWRDNGELARQFECSCTLGAESCTCGAAAGNESSVDAGAGESSGLVLEALRNETEQSLSLWWAGGGFHHGWGHGPWGWGHRGFRCGRVGWGGCGCRWGGCRCGRAGFGGCR